MIGKSTKTPGGFQNKIVVADKFFRFVSESIGWSIGFPSRVRGVKISGNEYFMLGGSIREELLGRGKDGRIFGIINIDEKAFEFRRERNGDISGTRFKLRWKNLGKSIIAYNSLFDQCDSANHRGTSSGCKPFPAR